MMHTGGEDYDSITDHQLTFSPSVSSLNIPINISSDGHFEESESFFVILSASNFHLELNTESPVSLRQSVCKDEKVFSLSDDNNIGAIKIDLERIFLTQTSNGIAFNLAANESERVSVGPAMINVTILDTDCKLVIHSKLPLS